MSKRTLSIPHLGRVEGHGGIYVRIEDDEVREVNLEVYEGSRYYEALLRGKHVDDVQGIITRVCAICSASHTVAALMALEDALGITVSTRTHTLRGLLLLGSTIESHALHIFALALPDFFHVPSVLELAASHPREVTFGLKLKQLGNRIQEGSVDVPSTRSTRASEGSAASRTSASCAPSGRNWRRRSNPWPARSS
ncbi:MAG: nickel-dependent hydrogenase large subunit [Candidatus Eisenbacteria bacterium]|nr:nickel-dependent hydrogenase large subunit [Candidatus Eisenbacteria bacterium]